MSELIWADLARDVVIVQGDDAATFLHSQLANDISSMLVGESRHSLLLEPTGHISSLVRVVRHADTVFTLDVEAGGGETVVTRLKKFILRAKVTLKVSDWVVRAFRGDNAAALVGSGAGRAIPYWGSPDEIDVVAERSQLPEIGKSAELSEIDVTRVDAHWPRLGADVLVGDIPATVGLLPTVVSFTKGCYPGQELVERMDSRGSLAPVVVRKITNHEYAVGDTLFEGDENVGLVTSVGTQWALARVSRNSALGEPLS